MRALKFRVWNKKENKWEFGYETMGGVNLFGEVHVMGYFKLEDLNNYEPMQFTGLLDKHGKEVYEGDILKREFHFSMIATHCRDCKKKILDDTFENHEVVFDNGKFITKQDLKYLESTMSGFFDDWDKCEIIGNVYETPELLKA